jgi:hypothetical protein
MISRRSLLLAGIAVTGCRASDFPASATQTVAVRNTITLRDASRSGVDHYPMRIGRPFAEGEIADAPQAVIDGRPVPTQADVKTRWPNGSVQHAILSFIVPRISGSVAVGFTNQAQPPAPPLTVQQMLDPAFNFDATIEIATDGQTKSASARAVLQAGDYNVWCQGPIATTIVLADHSSQRKYDLGFDSMRPVRPIFHATFWPELKKVHVRFIGENTNTETLQDALYSLVLRIGQTSPEEVFRQNAVPHFAATRWTKSFWIGGEPATAIDVDHNLPYLSRTRSFLNFDPSLRIGAGTIAQDYENWRKQPRDLYDAGGWMKYMPSTGGRNDIGPYPGTVAKWLYTGDHRHFEIVSGMADLAGAWPMNVREGNAAKRFDAQQSIPAIGRPVSVFARPSLKLFDERNTRLPQDRVVVQGPRLEFAGKKYNGGWEADSAHQPDPFSALYTLTGDYWTLEQLQLWAASQTVGLVVQYKGPEPSGGIIGQVRGDAWVLRNRVHAAYLSPDGSPEKAYFTAMIDDALASWEGRRDIHGTRYEGTPQWRFGQTRQFLSPLHVFDEQSARGDGGVKLDVVATTTAIWTNYMLIVELGRAKEKGFAAGPLLSWLGTTLTAQFREPETYSPTNVQRFQTPVRRRDGTLFKTWTETLEGFTNPEQPPAIRNDGCDGVARMAYAASTMLVDEPGGRIAYEFLRQNLYDKFSNLNSACSKWSILPRT